MHEFVRVSKLFRLVFAKCRKDLAYKWLDAGTLLAHYPKTVRVNGVTGSLNRRHSLARVAGFHILILEIGGVFMEKRGGAGGPIFGPAVVFLGKPRLREREH